jgi:UDP-glucose:(glucosyl)LPS alpha-1,2-glucosyltransferase
MKPIGGTEISEMELKSRLDKGCLDNVNLMLTHCSPNNLKKGMINVLWQHLGPTQDATKFMGDRKFVDSVDWFVYVSHWQFNEFRKHYNIPEHKSVVIKNATPIVPYFDNKPNEKIKLIYSSIPWGGLQILLGAIDILNQKRNDFQLEVYSSLKIYGSEFEKQNIHNFHQLFEKCKNTPNVNYKEYAPNEEIRKELKTADVLTYPCVLEETSCIAIIEAMAAGCHVLTTNTGALAETCGEFATMVEIDSSGYTLIEKYAEKLDIVLDNVKNNLYENQRKIQMDYYAKFYSWENRILEWNNFFKKIKK